LFCFYPRTATASRVTPLARSTTLSTGIVHSAVDAYAARGLRADVLAHVPA